MITDIQGIKCISILVETENKCVSREGIAISKLYDFY
jgi:DNA-binding winged helix-turn-helix (wHTH) protein